MNNFSELKQKELININGGWDLDKMEKQSKIVLRVIGGVAAVADPIYNFGRGFADGIRGK
ncbi:hypothetical protein AAGC94_04805 [Clostridium sporogenes]|uniref:hypothetical protein n=1 Tax=Clostridium TaxID=1485 RepID=UPI0013D0A21F|nr:hypothetical protein [Clostridium sporogenes]NFS24185.1 hypothetical protein [Clostridium sporogenes]